MIFLLWHAVLEIISGVKFFDPEVTRYPRSWSSSGHVDPEDHTSVLDKEIFLYKSPSNPGSLKDHQK